MMVNSTFSNSWHFNSRWPAAQRWCWLGFSSSYMRISHPVFKTQEQGCSGHDSLPCSSNHTKISTESQKSLDWRRPLRSWSPTAFHKPTMAEPVCLPCKAQKWTGSSEIERSSQHSHEMSAQTTVCVQTFPKRTGLSAASIHPDQCQYKRQSGMWPRRTNCEHPKLGVTGTRLLKTLAKREGEVWGPH